MGKAKGCTAHCQFCGTACSKTGGFDPSASRTQIQNQEKPVCIECHRNPRGTFPQWPFLRIYKPMLKRAWNLPNYQDVRELIQLWMWAKRIRALLNRQNDALTRAARERDELLYRSAR